MQISDQLMRFVKKYLCNFCLSLLSILSALPKAAVHKLITFL